MHLPNNKMIIKFKLENTPLPFPYPNTVTVSMFPVSLDSSLSFKMLIVFLKKKLSFSPHFSCYGTTLMVSAVKKSIDKLSIIPVATVSQ